MVCDPTKAHIQIVDGLDTVVSYERLDVNNTVSSMENTL